MYKAQPSVVIASKPLREREGQKRNAATGGQGSPLESMRLLNLLTLST